MISAEDIAVDGAGRAYVTGGTVSTDFPTTAGAAQTTHAGVTDIFVTRLEATGSGLVYSTYLGGSAGEGSGGIAVDGVGNAYVTGDTGSTDFPTTAGAIQSTHAGRSDAFLTKLAATGSELVYSTYLGASDDDSGFGIAVDGAGSAYVVGSTFFSTDFPTTPGAFQTMPGGAADAFVARIATLPNVERRVQERRLEDLRRVQEPRRLRELCCEQGQDPGLRAVAIGRRRVRGSSPNSARSAAHHLSQVFAGQNVGVKQVNERISLVTFHAATAWATSSTRRARGSRARIRSARKCYPCLRNDLLPHVRNRHQQPSG